MASTSPSALSQIGRVLRYAAPYKWLLVVAVLASLAFAAGDTGRAYLIKPLADDVLMAGIEADSLGKLLALGDSDSPDLAQLERERETLLARVRSSIRAIAVATLFILIGMPLLRFVRDYTSEWVMQRLLIDLQIRIGTKLLALPLGYYQQHSRGDFISRVTSDVGLVNRAQFLIFGDAIRAFALIGTSLAAAFYLSWQMTLIALIVVPPLGFVFQIFGRRIRKSGRARQEQIAEVVQRLMQMLSGLKVIKAFGAQDREQTAYRNEVHRFFRRSMKVIRNRVYSRSLAEFLAQAVFVSVFWVGIYAITNRIWDLTLGTLLAYLFIIARLLRPMRSLTQIYNSMQDALPSVARYFETLDMTEEPPDPPGAVELSTVRDGIRYRDVVFNYGREPVLQGVDLSIGVGEVVALIGRTGAGKTTLADLLLRFGQPQQGSIEIDGIDLRQIRTDSLRRLIAVVTQEPFLFDTDILDNIRYGRPEASYDDVVRAAEAGNIHEFITGLPNGYATRVGEVGSQLSGGQRQRITIARAILRDPRILIFDEATSALDAKAEAQVQRAIWNLMRGRTVLVIAHRLSTVKAADRIAVLEDGVISMIGPHAELMARGGLYRELVNLELSDARPAAD